MALAEKRALDSVAGERIKMERILLEANNNNNINSSSSNINRKQSSENLELTDTQPASERAAKDQVFKKIIFFFSLKQLAYFHLESGFKTTYDLLVTSLNH
jgi:hypothetical protein